MRVTRGEADADDAKADDGGGGGSCAMRCVYVLVPRAPEAGKTAMDFMIDLGTDGPGSRAGGVRQGNSLFLLRRGGSG